MTAEQKSKLAQGLFYGVFFILLGDFITWAVPEVRSVKQGGKAAMILGGVMVLWGLAQLLPRRK